MTELRLWLWPRVQRLGGTTWIMVVSAMVFVASIAVIVMVPSPSNGKVGRLCDAAVDQLLTTKDAVELRRAMFLVRWFDCGIRRRLP